MKLRTLIAAGAIALTTAGCLGSTGIGTKQAVGGLGGAALGGFVGSQFGDGTGQLAFTAAGAVLGALAGSEIGRALDENDRREAARANQLARAAPIGRSITWNNPDSGNYGSVTPTRDGIDSSGSYCREFQQSVTVGGRTQAGYGTACRQPDGSWEIVS